MRARAGVQRDSDAFTMLRGLDEDSRCSVHCWQFRRYTTAGKPSTIPKTMRLLIAVYFLTRSEAFVLPRDRCRVSVSRSYSYRRDRNRPMYCIHLHPRSCLTTLSAQYLTHQSLSTFQISPAQRCFMPTLCPRPVHTPIPRIQQSVSDDCGHRCSNHFTSATWLYGVRHAADNSP